MITTISSKSGEPFDLNDNKPLDEAFVASNIDELEKLPSAGIVKNYVGISTQGINYVTVGKDDETANFNTADYATDWGAIVAAYNYAKVNNKQSVFVKNGTYNVNNGPRLLYVGGVSLIGESKEGVIIQGSRTFDWLLINLSGQNYYFVNGFRIKNFTIDLQNGAFASAFRFYSVRNVIVEKCHFKNGAVGGWFVSWGSSNHEDANNKGFNNQEIDCTYDTHQGSLEMVLVYNQDYYRSIRPTFLNKGTTIAGPVLGLWQNCKNPQIISPRFINNNGYNYYSITTDNAYFENIYAENTGAVLQGANVSDNTVFGPKTGIDRVKGLVINGFTAIGGVNSRTSCALQLGAVEDFDVTVNHVEGYNQSVLFDRGNHQCFANSRRGRLKIGTLKNCNPNGTASAINPAIFFNGAGKYDIIIEGGEVFDDQLVKTQLYPISFNEPHVEPTITFTVASGVITGATVVNGGAGLPKARSAAFPLVLNVTGGTGAIIHAYTSWNGIVTSVVVVNGGSGFTTPIVGSIVTETYENITVNNSRLIGYSGNPSVHRLAGATLANSVKFNDIREPTKGTLSAYYYDLSTAHTHTSTTNNPHNVTKTQVGLADVDNTSDANKPLSTIQKNYVDNPFSWTPDNYGYLSWSYDPAMISNTSALVNGASVGIKLRVPRAITITNIIININAGVGVDNCFVALYQNNNLLAQSSNQTDWNVGGNKVIPLSSPQTVVAGTVDVIVWCGTSTSAPLLQRSGSQGGTNGSFTGVNLRWFTANTGLSTTAPATLGTRAVNNNTFWAAVS